MADREDQSNLPPIPDGGLSESMPDWLRRPPAWRTLPDREVTAPELEGTAALPEPDDSVIDPRTFLSDDDLPEWLRNLGPGRRVERPAERESEAADTDVVPSGDRTPAPDQPSEQPARKAPARFVPTSPPALMAPGPDPTASRHSTERSAPPAARQRHGTGLVALLAGLLVIAIVVIIVLAVT